MVDDRHDRTPTEIPDLELKVQIDKEYFHAPKSLTIGFELLRLAGKLPPDDYAIYLKVEGGQPERIGLDEAVDLSRPGVERFVTLPLDQTEGLGARRDFGLPDEDVDWLISASHRFEFVAEAGVLRVVLYGFPVPRGYNQQAVDVNVRIEAGYPDTQIDMVYVYPELRRLDGVPIGTTCFEEFDNKQWQRWSRHRTPANPWRPGVDNLATHFALVEHWFARELQKG